jgi:CheY-like chemotaxis protein
MSESATLTAAGVPTVYFIDDSATMREVIKIAFRKENMQVITCADAASALAQFAEAAPDAVITDVIMPDKDGYEVCDFIKQHEEFSSTPVILMSGVVNKTVAERATSVKADELIRKPFHPQDLVGRVKGLLAAKFPALAPASKTVAPLAPAVAPAASAPAPTMLTNFFAPPPSSPVPGFSSNAGSMPFATAAPEPRAIAPVAAAPPGNSTHRAPAASSSAPAVSAGSSNASSLEVMKLRNDVRRLEMLVKKLQAELEAEHEYCASLEQHLKTLQE